MGKLPCHSLESFHRAREGLLTNQSEINVNERKKGQSSFNVRARARYVSLECFLKLWTLPVTLPSDSFLLPKRIPLGKENLSGLIIFMF